MIRWTLETLDGHPLGAIGPERSGGLVRRAINDGRTASLDVSVFDDVVPKLLPLRVKLTARYFDAIVFGGVLQIPDHKAAEGKVATNWQDPSRRLDAAPLIDPRVTYSSLDQVVEATRAARYGFPLAPDHGIKAQPGAAAARQPAYTGMATAVKGSLAPGRGPFPRLELSAGVSGWGVFQQASESMFGPEFVLRPIEHVPGTWDYTTLDIAPRIGRELQDSPDVVFEFGFGRNNCVDAGYAPGGDRVVNAYFAEVGTEGEGDEAVPLLEGFYSPDEILELGFYAGYEGAGGCTGASGSAIAQVAAYRSPPEFFTVQPAIERRDGSYGGYTPDGTWVGGLGAPPRYGVHYEVGDTIAVVVHHGTFRRRLEGRITNAELKEVDDQGNVQVTLECAPRVSIAGITRDIGEFGTGTFGTSADSTYAGDKIAAGSFRGIPVANLDDTDEVAIPRPAASIFRGISTRALVAAEVAPTTNQFFNTAGGLPSTNTTPEFAITSNLPAPFPVEYRIDGGPFIRVANNTWTIAAQPVGVHTIDASPIDPATNLRGPRKSLSFEVQAPPPPVDPATAFNGFRTKAIAYTPAVAYFEHVVCASGDPHVNPSDGVWPTFNFGADYLQFADAAGMSNGQNNPNVKNYLFRLTTPPTGNSFRIQIGGATGPHTVFVYKDFKPDGQIYTVDGAQRIANGGKGSDPNVDTTYAHDGPGIPYYVVVTMDCRQRLGTPSIFIPYEFDFTVTAV